MKDNEEKLSKNERFKNALCYIPLVAIVLFFAEDNKTKELMKYIKYWISILIIYLFFIFIFTKFLRLDISAFITTIYILLSAYLWYKAYNGQDINIEYIDKMEDKIKTNLEENFPEAKSVSKKVKNKIQKKQVLKRNSIK